METEQILCFIRLGLKIIPTSKLYQGPNEQHITWNLIQYHEFKLKYIHFIQVIVWKLCIYNCFCPHQWIPSMVSRYFWSKNFGNTKYLSGMKEISASGKSNLISCNGECPMQSSRPRESWYNKYINRLNAWIGTKYQVAQVR